jgi:glutamine amidotransferase
VHNGYVADFQRVHRELLFAVAPELFSNIRGSTDSELLFHLALTFGLEENPLRALERMVGFVEEVARRHDIADPLHLSAGLCDGQTLYAVRYASSSGANTLFVSERVDAIRALYPEHERSRHLRRGARAVVSEPLFKLPGAWLEVPESTALVVSASEYQTRAFEPRPPSRA